MRSIYRYVATAAAGMLLAPTFAAASDIEADVADMKQRVEAMEDQLRAQTDELADAQATVEKQNEVIEKAGLVERDEVSALSSFIEATDFSAFVAASYNYNFRGTEDANEYFNPLLPVSPTNPLTPGTQGNAFNTGTANPLGVWYPQHRNNNTFQLDQAWIAIDKAPTDESRGGAHIDLAAGDGLFTNGATAAAGNVTLYSAYVSYLAPLANGVRIDGGIMPTILGYEVEQTNANWNITRGITWGLQPVTSTGFLTTTEIVDGFTIQLGMLNDPIGRVNVDGNTAKALTSKVSYSAEKFGASVGVNWGRGTVGLNGNANQSQGLLDVILTINPLDNLSAYINYDFRFEKNRTANYPSPANSFSLNTNAIAVGARLAIIDSTGFAVRAEYINSKDSTPVNIAGSVPPLFNGGFINTSFGGRAPQDTISAWSLTGTLDHSLTDNLTAKFEVRYDDTDPGLFLRKDGTTTPFSLEGQTVALVQMIYEF
jgi:hypothetical protein